jgi:hypothetical protein
MNDSIDGTPYKQTKIRDPVWIISWECEAKLKEFYKRNVEIPDLCYIEYEGDDRETWNLRNINDKTFNMLYLNGNYNPGLTR